MDNIKSSSALVQDVINGVEDPLVAYAILKQEEAHIKACLVEIEGAVAEEKDKYSDKTFEHQGYKFEKRAGGVTWDFKHIPEWKELKDRLGEIENKYKAAYNASQGGLITADGETGEDTVLPTCKPRKDSLVLKSK